MVRLQSLLDAQAGYGTWTSGAGWLCDDSDKVGNLAGVFGAPTTLTAASATTYSNLAREEESQNVQGAAL